MEDSLYGNAHPLFYEPIDSRPLGLAYIEHLRHDLLPPHWRMRRWDVWLGAAPEDGSAELISHGFKIHVSSTPRHARRTLDLVVPELVRRNIQFKIAGDPYLLNVRNGFIGSFSPSWVDTEVGSSRDDSVSFTVRNYRAVAMAYSVSATGDYSIVGHSASGTGCSAGNVPAAGSVRGSKARSRRGG